MFYKSWLTWSLILYAFCSTIAKPATSNLASHVPDNWKSIVMFVTTMSALWVTYKISSLGDEEATKKVQKHYGWAIAIILLIDAVVIYHDNMFLRYALEACLDKVVGPLFGVMVMDARRKEAKKMGTDIGGLWRRMEFPKCAVVALGGLVGLYIYQPDMGLTIQQGLWLEYAGVAMVDMAIIKTVYDRE